MSRTFTTATDDSLIALIAGAQNRLAVIAPGLTTPVARALAARMKELPVTRFLGHKFVSRGGPD